MITDFIEQMQNFQMQREMEAQQYEKRLKKQKQFIFDLEKEQREILVAMKEDNQEEQIMELKEEIRRLRFRNEDMQDHDLIFIDQKEEITSLREQIEKMEDEHEETITTLGENIKELQQGYEAKLKEMETYIEEKEKLDPKDIARIKKYKRQKQRLKKKYDGKFQTM